MGTNPIRKYCQMKNPPGIVHLALWKVQYWKSWSWWQMDYWYSCLWANYCTWVSEMLFLEHAAKLNPPTRSHRSLFNPKSLVSDMGKLGRKRVLSRHSRWSAATQTTRCLEELYTTNGFTSLNNKKSKSEQRKLPMSTYLTQWQNVGRSADPSKCLRVSARPVRHYR